MGKASLAFAVIVAVVFATGGRQATAEVSPATVDQYLTEVGEDASTTSQGFRESRSEGPEALATSDTSSNSNGNAANTSSAPKSGMTRDTSTAPPSASSNVTTGNVEAGEGRTGNLSRLPETGGPDATTFLWGLIALASLLPCLRIARTAATCARGPG